MDSTFETLKKNWVIFMFIGGLIISWTQFQSKISALEVRVTSDETKIDQALTTVQNINVTLAQIQTTLDFIKTNLNK